MSVKIVNGLVGSPQQYQAGGGSQRAQEVSPKAMLQVQQQVVAAARSATSEAVSTTVYTSVRKVGASEGIPSFDKAKNVAGEVAERIRSDRNSDAHGGLEELGERGVVRQHFV